MTVTSFNSKPRAPRTGLLATVVALALVAAGCGQSRDDQGAGSVSFPDGSTRELTDAETFVSIGEVVQAPEFKAAVFQGATEPQIAAAVTQIAVQGKVLDEIIENEDVTITDEDRATGAEAARTQFDGAFGSPEAQDEALDAVPTFISTLGYFIAQQEALETHFGADGEQLPCARHILVETSDEADDVVARIDGGDDFAVVAAEVSTDVGSGAAGGELGCVSTAQYVPEFAAAVDNADLNEIVVAESDFGFHVIEVTGYEADGSAGIAAAFDELIREAVITINPELGEWDPEAGFVRAVSDEPSGGLEDESGE